MTGIENSGSQPPPSVSLLGGPGSYHDIACDYLSPEARDPQRVRCNNFADILEKLDSGETDQAVIAVANSEIGALWDAYDLIAQHDIYAVGEVRLRIVHSLLVLPEVVDLSNIETVLSNAKALKQCEKYLADELPDADQQTGSDTATCAQTVAERGDPRTAAIASSQAAELYGLIAIRTSIETNPDNETRFLLFERDAREIPDANKTSLIMATSNKPRALYEALGPWAMQNIGLSMLESRLMPHQVRSVWGAHLHAQGQHEELERLRRDDPINPWEAHFYIDVEAGLQEDHMQEAMTELSAQEGVETRILGSYRRSKLVE